MAALATLYLATLALLNLPPVRRLLRDRAVDTLARRLPTARLEGAVHVDAALRLVMGPVVIGPSGGGPALLVVDRVSVRPALGRLLRGRLEAGTVALRGVRVEAGRGGERLRDLARILRPERPGGAPGGPGRPVPVIDFSGMALRLEGSPGGPPLVVGPLGGRLRLERQGEGTRASLALQGPGRSEGRVEATWGGGPGGVTVRLRGMGAEALPEGLRARLPIQIRSGAMDLALEAPGLETFGHGEGRLTLTTRELALASPSLATEPVGPLSCFVAGRVRWDAGARAAALEEATVALDAAGRTALKVALSVAARPEAAFALSVRAEAVDWAALAAALPPALAPPAAAPPLAGTLGGALRISGPLHRPADWQLEGEVDPSRLTPLQARGGPDLTRPFVHEAQRTRGGTRRVVLGPENPAFVPLADLPEHLVRAVLQSEDAGFFGHKGFDFSEVQDALTTEGRLRGASTLTQQLAKNLFLSRDRTLARKIREALATLALEAALGKRRILEIYLNLAEWGDGVYGIGEAARHWFGKDARTLSPKEAAMLATVIPNPVRYERYLRRGALTPAWEARVGDLLAKLHAAGVLDDDALRAAEAEPLVFAGRPAPLDPQAEPEADPDPP